MYTEFMYKDSLTHFGIHGQKWGVRRFQNPDRTWTEAGKKRYGHTSSTSEIPNKKEVRKIKKQLKKKAKIAKKQEQEFKRSDKYIESLSDQELRNEINRLQMEKQYKDLTKKKDNAAKKFVKDVAYESAKEVAKEYTKKGIKAGILILSDTASGGKYEPYESPDVYDGYYEFDEDDWSKKKK